MVDNIRVTDGYVAQAVYTWTLKRIDGSKGLGFSAISPSLETSIDWLTRLQPAEFKLFRVNEPAPELYEARQGFSEVGRTVRGKTGIIYCKTADGTLDVNKRPHPVVHALIADSETLGFLSASRIRQDFWIRQIEQSEVAGFELRDVELADIIDSANASDVHSCSTGHDAAIQFLCSLVAYKKGDADIITSSYPETVSQMLLAFPEYIVENFVHSAYVALNGVEHEIGIRLPRPGLAASGASLAHATPADCPIQRAARAAAAKYLMTGHPSIGRYAEAVLQTMHKPATSMGPRPAPPPAVPEAPEQWTGAAVTGPSLASGQVIKAMLAVRGTTEGERFTDKESLTFLERLRQAGVQEEVLDADPQLLLTLFGDISDRNVLVKWSQAWTRVEIDSFIDLWNSTHIAAFLGMVLLRNLKPPHALSRKISPDRGVSPDTTVRVLRAMNGHGLRGGASIGQVIKAGFGSSEPMRAFICETFSEWPSFLYNVVLENAEPTNDQMIDYIRYGYNSWARYHKLSKLEAAAMQELVALRPNFLDRLKLLLGKQAPG